MQILGLAVGEYRLVRILALDEARFELLERYDKIQLSPGGSIILQFGNGGRRPQNFPQDRVHADVTVVSVGVEQLLQVVHGVKRLEVLLVQLHRAHPDGGLGERGATVVGEGVLHHYAVLRKAANLRRVIDSGVVRRDKILAQAVKHEQENVRLSAG